MRSHQNSCAGCDGNAVGTKIVAGRLKRRKIGQAISAKSRVASSKVINVERAGNSVPLAQAAATSSAETMR
jgi:hypothetical protein